jgi:hypothetical protein
VAGNLAGMNRGLNLAVITEENEDSGGVISEADIEVKFPDHKDDFLLEIEKRRPASIRSKNEPLDLSENRRKLTYLRCNKANQFI